MTQLMDIINPQVSARAATPSASVAVMPDRRGKTAAEIAAEKIRADAQAKIDALLAEQAALDARAEQLATSEAERQAQKVKAQAHEDAVTQVNEKVPHVINFILRKKQEADTWRTRAEEVIEFTRQLNKQQGDVRQAYLNLMGQIGFDLTPYAAAWESDASMVTFIIDLVTQNYYPTGWFLPTLTAEERRFFGIFAHGIPHNQAVSAVTSGINQRRKLIAQGQRLVKSQEVQTKTEQPPPGGEDNDFDNEEGAASR